MKFQWFKLPGIALLSGLAMGACNDDNIQGEEESLQQSDRDFMIQAAYSHHSAIEFGTLVKTKGKFDAVQIYAAAVVDEQQNALNDLEEIADDLDYNLPTGLDDDSKDVKVNLETLTGVAFDRTYIESQILAYAKAEAGFEYQVQNGKNKRLVHYAEARLPEIRIRLDKAESIRVEFEEPSSSGRKSKTLRKK